MQFSRQVSDIHEVVMDASLFYEGALGVRDKVVHMRGHLGSHRLGNYLRKSVNEANGASEGVLD